MTRDEKAREIEALRADFSGARHAFLLGFAGLSVAQIEDLRRRVAGTGSAYRVVKNRLAARATEGTPLAPLGGHFRGETGVAYNAGDPVALAKALTEFVKDNPLARLRLGLVDGRDVLHDRELEIERLASDVLLHTHGLPWIAVPEHIDAVVAVAGDPEVPVPVRLHPHRSNRAALVGIRR